MRRRRRHDRPPRMVPAGQISLLPGLRASAAGAGPRDQQAGEPVGRRPQLGDHAAGVERAALDEHQPARIASRTAQAARLHRQSPGRRAAGRPFQRFPVRRPAARGDTRGGASSRVRGAFARTSSGSTPAGECLGFTAAKRERRQEWMLDPEIKGVGSGRGRAHAGARAGAPRLGRPAARLAVHQPESGGVGPRPCRLSFRSTILLPMTTLSPTLRPSSARQHPTTRRKALRILLDHLRHGLAITTDALDPGNVEAIGNASRQSLREPWSISQQEDAARRGGADHRCPETRRGGLRGEPLIVRGGARSMLARQLGTRSIWGKRLDSKTYLEVVAALLAAAAQYQLVRSGRDPLRRRGLAARGERGPARRCGWSCRRHAANPYFS